MSLYTQYRPNNWDSVVWQHVIVTILRSSIKNNTTSHAYIFTGSRWTGKTTSARLLAKALNCQQPIEWNPCQKCENCIAFNEGSFVDMIEIDAASNTGVDNIRELIEASTFMPTKWKYKIYIIDEVHMLSTGAFNALLKIMEEPPEYVKFILATTDIHKVPETILSRAQRFDFKKISVKDIVSTLSAIVQEKNIQSDPWALELIAEFAKWWLRDALTLLEQYTIEGAIRKWVLEESFSLVNEETLSTIIDSILHADIQRLLSSLELLSSNHIWAKGFFDQMLLFLRDIIKNTIQTESITGYIKIIDTIQKNYHTLGSISNEYVWIELTLFEAYYSCNTSEVNHENLPKSIDNKIASKDTFGENRKPEEYWENTVRKEISTSHAPEENSNHNVSEQEIKTWSNETNKNAQLLNNNWKEFKFLDFLQKTRSEPVIFTALKNTEFSQIENTLTLRFSSKWHYDKIRETKNSNTIITLLEEMYGGKWTLETVLQNSSNQINAVNEIF